MGNRTPINTLSIPNKEIQNWLESREFIYHYAGRGDWTFAHYSPYKPEEVDHADKCQDTGYPRYYAPSFNTVYLDKEYSSTYAFPSVHLKIAKSEIDDITYDVEICFAHLRAGDNYEKVFYGYIQSLEELIQTFRLLGVEEKYLD